MNVQFSISLIKSQSKMPWQNGAGAGDTTTQIGRAALFACKRQDGRKKQGQTARLRLKNRRFSNKI
jgi:hypothetical protein